MCGKPHFFRIRGFTLEIICACHKDEAKVSSNADTLPNFALKKILRDFGALSVIEVRNFFMYRCSVNITTTYFSAFLIQISN
jgi:hypothetical protein